VRERSTARLVGKIAKFQGVKFSMTRQQVRIDSGPLLLGQMQNSKLRRFAENLPLLTLKPWSLETLNLLPGTLTSLSGYVKIRGRRACSLAFGVWERPHSFRMIGRPRWSICNYFGILR
jgi:hypothetical protein